MGRAHSFCTHQVSDTLFINVRQAQRYSKWPLPGYVLLEVPINTVFMMDGWDVKKCKAIPRVPWERTHSELRNEPPHDASNHPSWMLCVEISKNSKEIRSIWVIVRKLQLQQPIRIKGNISSYLGVLLIVMKFWSYLRGGTKIEQLGSIRGTFF